LFNVAFVLRDFNKRSQNKSKTEHDISADTDMTTQKRGDNINVLLM